MWLTAKMLFKVLQALDDFQGFQGFSRSRVNSGGGGGNKYTHTHTHTHTHSACSNHQIGKFVHGISYFGFTGTIITPKGVFPSSVKHT